MNFVISFPNPENEQWISNLITIAAVIIGGLITYYTTYLFARRERRQLNKFRANTLLFKLKKIADVSINLSNHVKKEISAAKERGITEEWAALEPFVGAPRAAPSIEADDVAFLGLEQSPFVNSVLELTAQFGALVDLVETYNKERTIFVPDKMIMKGGEIAEFGIEMDNPKQVLHLKRIQSLANLLVQESDRIEAKSREVVTASTAAIKAALNSDKISTLAIPEGK